ncbi:hypothetical protein [Priestia flexa]|uniref:hypothetical protein n=1 Tax=Priestia flexa TaxID=86664 RepID=UPI002490D7C5|nr:hypothetical protein [Priestia flexa]
MIQWFFEHVAMAFLLLTALAIYIGKHANKDEKKQLIKALKKAPKNFYNNVKLLASKIKSKGEGT